MCCRKRTTQLSISPQTTTHSHRFLTRRCDIARYKNLPKAKEIVWVQKKRWFDTAYRWGKVHWKAICFVSMAVVTFLVLSGFIIYQQRRGEFNARLEYLEVEKIPDETLRAERFEEFARNHKGNEASKLALMRLGAYYTSIGGREKAIGFYEAVLGKSKGKPIYFIALDALAPLYIDSGRPADSVTDIYIKSSELHSCPNPYNLRMKAASLYLLAGDAARAEVIYQDIINDKNAPPIAVSKAREQLLWLTAK